MLSLESFKPLHLAAAAVAGELKITSRELFFNGVLVDKPSNVQVIISSLTVAIDNGMASRGQIDGVLIPLRDELLVRFPQSLDVKKVEKPQIEQETPQQQWDKFLADWDVARERGVIIYSSKGIPYTDEELTTMRNRMSGVVGTVLDLEVSQTKLGAMRDSIEVFATYAPCDKDWRNRFKGILLQLIDSEIVKRQGK